MSAFPQLMNEFVLCVIALERVIYLLLRLHGMGNLRHQSGRKRVEKMEIPQIPHKLVGNEDL